MLLTDRKPTSPLTGTLTPVNALAASENHFLPWQLTIEQLLNNRK